MESEKITCLGCPFLPPIVVTIIWPVSVPFPSTTVASISFILKIFMSIDVINSHAR